MLLRRIGNKSKIAKDIIKYFPHHTFYIEPFFGAGGLFFNKPLAKYNYLNDLDGDIFNLFHVLQYNKDEFYDFVESVPYDKTTFKWFMKLEPVNDIEKAVKFIVLSNWSYLGNGKSLKFGMDNNKKITLQNIKHTYNYLFRNKDANIKFNNADFRVFLNEFGFVHDGLDKQNAFIYCDPPYLGTDDNYSDSFKEQDFRDLVQTCIDSGIKFAISEFDNEIVKTIALENNLNIIPICERRTLKSRNIEILITNYEIPKNLFTENINNIKQT